MLIIVNIPTDKYNNIVFEDVEKLRESISNGVVLTKKETDIYNKGYNDALTDTMNALQQWFLVDHCEGNMKEVNDG